MYSLNLADIKSEVRGKIHQTGLSSDKIVRWANITQDYIWSEADLKSAKYERTFDTVADQETYYIDANIGRITSLVDTTNQLRLIDVSARSVDTTNPARTITGVPTEYQLFGKSEVSAQNSTASQIKVVSSSALDVTQYVRIIGLVSSVETSENKLLVGTTEQTTSITIDVGGVIGVRLSAACVGDVTVKAGTETLVVIPAGKLFKMYQPLRLNPVPSDIYSMKVEYIQGPRPMVSDYDIPDLPPEFHPLVLLGALAQAHEYVYEFDVSERFFLKLDKQIGSLSKKETSIRGDARSIRVRGLRPSGRVFGTYPTRYTGS